MKSVRAREGRGRKGEGSERQIEFTSQITLLPPLPSLPPTSPIPPPLPLPKSQPLEQRRSRRLVTQDNNDALDRQAALGPDSSPENQYRGRPDRTDEGAVSPSESSPALSLSFAEAQPLPSYPQLHLCNLSGPTPPVHRTLCNIDVR